MRTIGNILKEYLTAKNYVLFFSLKCQPKPYWKRFFVLVADTTKVLILFFIC